ncbi:hypothetical protein EV183_000994 [Coemansia sp. RSA 2336]|nr:hypothetical protein EV183_000994 [Coemansia sp. RSA 2336]
MYGTNNHSYSTPTSPSPYCNAHSNDGKTAYDKELAALFRATAANVTQLYKEASNIGQDAYNSGYEQCFKDIWDFVLTAQSEGHMPASTDRQQIMQHLAEFARNKQLSRQARFAALDENTLNLATENNRSSADQAIDAVADEGNRVFSDSACSQEETAPIPTSDNTEAHGTIQPIAVPQPSQSPRSDQSARNKRTLEFLESMDIEPPRRRQRRDDIDMV